MLSPASGMLLDLAEGLDARRWLVLGGELSLVAGILGDHPGAHVCWAPVDVRDLDQAQQMFVDAPAARLEIRDDPAWPGGSEQAFDAVVFATSLHRPLVRRWLAHAYHVLAQGGHLLLAGANDAGVRSAIGDAKRLFGDPVGEDYRRRHRVASFRRDTGPDEYPYWFDQPGIAPGTWQAFDVTVRGHAFALHTLPGVFPGDRLDTGTALLLEHLTVASGARVLDAGCGTGVIGLLAARLGATRVDLIDANLLAIAAARENVSTLEIAGTRVLASDVYGAVAGQRYDLIVSNPPFHQGKAIDTSMPDRLISEAPDHLLLGGQLLLVANSFLRYERRMHGVFREVETVAATRQYHIIAAAGPR